MLQREHIRESFLALKRDIRRQFPTTEVDYRKRCVSAERVAGYLQSNLTRYITIVETVLSMGRGSTILDIGIAYGFHDIVLVREYGMDVTGVELEENIPTYCGLCLEAGIEIIPGFIGDTALPLSDESYDVVILAEVLEHLRISPLRALNEIHRILKLDGYLLLTTPNIASLHKIMNLVLGRNILEEFVEDDSSLNHVTDSWTHIREYTMDELVQLLLKGGFTIQERRYISVDRHRSDQKSIPVTIYHFIAGILIRVLSRYRDILFIVARKKSVGAR